MRFLAVLVALLLASAARGAQYRIIAVVVQGNQRTVIVEKIQKPRRVTHYAPLPLPPMGRYYDGTGPQREADRAAAERARYRPSRWTP